MKKIVALLLAVALVCGAAFALGSCGKNDDNKLVVAMSPDFAPMEFVITASDSTCKAYENVMKQYVTDYKVTANDVVGFDVILANYLGKKLGKKVEIARMSFDAAQMAVQTGKADLGISGFSWMPDRAENFEITDWYVAGDNETEQVLITTKANAGKYTTVESVKGAKVGYQGASLQQQLVKETFGDSVTQSAFKDLGTATEALKNGKIDVLAVAKGNGDSIMANNEDTIIFSGFKFEVADLYKNNVVLIKKGNTDLLTKVNAALKEAKDNDYYTGWYEAAQIIAGSKNADELGYDDDGNKIQENQNQ